MKTGRIYITDQTQHNNNLTLSKVRTNNLRIKNSLRTPLFDPIVVRIGLSQDSIKAVAVIIEWGYY